MGKSRQVNLSQQFRRKQTEAEKTLWLKLRNRQLDGVKFRRQQPIGSYIVDFISFDKKLIIEIDGGQHNELHTIERDKQRTKWLESEGFHVMRFWNNDVLLNIEGVLLRINEVLGMESHPHPTLSHQGRGM